MKKAAKEFESGLSQKLSGLQEQGLERRLMHFDAKAGASGGKASYRFDFSSNDYLGLTRHPRVVQASASAQCAGAGSARLVRGTRHEHTQLEADLAEWQGREGALLYGAGYLANVGILSALFTRNDIIFADRYVHASLIDGILLARCAHRRFRHNDIGHLETLLAKEGERRSPTARFCIVAESVYSMHGDLSPLCDLVALAERYQALLVIDEAHALGVYGAGRVHSANLQDSVDIVSGSFGKAIGGYGGFAAATGVVVRYLLNTSRSFIYNTALPPGVVLSAACALAIIREQPELGNEVLQNACYFRKLLADGGAQVGPEQSQIIPLMVGKSAFALELAERLRVLGVLVVAIRPPTVPEDGAMLRFSITLDHSRGALEEAAAIIIGELKALGVCL